MVCGQVQAGLLFVVPVIVGLAYNLLFQKLIETPQKIMI
jgi:hypothetical protein